MTKADILRAYPAIPQDFSLKHFLWGDPLLSDSLEVLLAYVDDELVGLRRQHVLSFIERYHQMEKACQLALSCLLVFYQAGLYKRPLNGAATPQRDHAD